MQRQISAYKWSIPSGINLPLLIQDSPPDFKYKIDYFYYILDLICQRMDYIKPNEKKEYALLNAKKLQGFITNYSSNTNCICFSCFTRFFN